MEEPLPFAEYSPFFPERTERLHAMLTNCGHRRTFDHNYSWDGLKRGSRELVIWQYTLSGMGRLRFGENEYPIPPGRGMLLIVPENHCYFLPEGTPYWEFLYVGVHGSEMVRLASEFRRRHGFLHEFSLDSPTVEAARQLLLRCHGHAITNRYAASAAAYRFMMALMEEPAANPGGGDEQFLRKVHAYCMEHLDQPISVNDLAEAVKCSRWHFTRRFQAAEGRSPHEFITELKMRLAVRLLQTSAGSVKEVAAACGYEDTSYFCKVFRKFYGTTHAGFRDRRQEG